MAPQRALRNILGCIFGLYMSAYAFRVFFNEVHIDVFFFFMLWLPAHADTFALGMFISTAVVAIEIFSKETAIKSSLVKMSPVLLLVSCATWFWSTQLGLALAFEKTSFGIELFGHFLYGITAVTFVLPFCLDQGNSRITKIFGSRVCVWLGTISYGMYLWHYLFLDGHFAIAHMPYQIGDMGIAARLLVTIPGSIAIASVSYYLVERPLIRTVNQALHKRKNSANRPDPRTA